MPLLGDDLKLLKLEPGLLGDSDVLSLLLPGRRLLYGHGPPFNRLSRHTLAFPAENLSIQRWRAACHGHGRRAGVIPRHSAIPEIFYFAMAHICMPCWAVS